MAYRDVQIPGVPELIAFPEEFTNSQVEEAIADPRFQQGVYKDYGVVLGDTDDLDDWEITKGAKTGYAAIGTGIAGSVATLAQKFGQPEIRDWAKKQLGDFQFQMLQHRGEHTTLESIGAKDTLDFLSSPEKMNAFVNWAAFNFGNGAATTIPAIIGGALAAFPGTTASIAGLGLLYGYGGVMGAGEGYSEALREGLTDEQAATIALKIAPFHAALERVGAGGVVLQQFKKSILKGAALAKATKKGTVRGKGVNEITEELKNAPGFVRNMATGFGKGALGEGVTEGAQTVLTTGAVQREKGNITFWEDNGFWKSVGEAAAAGAVAGGPLTSATEVYSGSRQKRHMQGFLDAVDKVKETNSPEAQPQTKEQMDEEGTPDSPGDAVDGDRQYWEKEGDDTTKPLPPNLNDATAEQREEAQRRARSNQSFDHSTTTPITAPQAPTPMAAAQTPTYGDLNDEQREIYEGLPAAEKDSYLESLVPTTPIDTPAPTPVPTPIKELSEEDQAEIGIDLDGRLFDDLSIEEQDAMARKWGMNIDEFASQLIDLGVSEGIDPDALLPEPDTRVEEEEVPDTPQKVKKVFVETEAAKAEAKAAAALAAKEAKISEEEAAAREEYKDTDELTEQEITERAKRFKGYEAEAKLLEKKADQIGRKINKLMKEDPAENYEDIINAKAEERELDAQIKSLKHKMRGDKRSYGTLDTAPVEHDEAAYQEQQAALAASKVKMAAEPVLTEEDEAAFDRHVSETTLGPREIARTEEESLENRLAVLLAMDEAFRQDPDNPELTDKQYAEMLSIEDELYARDLNTVIDTAEEILGEPTDKTNRANILVEMRKGWETEEELAKILYKDRPEAMALAAELRAKGAGYGEAKRIREILERTSSIDKGHRQTKAARAERAAVPLLDVGYSTTVDPVAPKDKRLAEDSDYLAGSYAQTETKGKKGVLGSPLTKEEIFERIHTDRNARKKNKPPDWHFSKTKEEAHARDLQDQAIEHKHTHKFLNETYPRDAEGNKKFFEEEYKKFFRVYSDFLQPWVIQAYQEQINSRRLKTKVKEYERSRSKESMKDRGRKIEEDSWANLKSRRTQALRNQKLSKKTYRAKAEVALGELRKWLDSIGLHDINLQLPASDSPGSEWQTGAVGRYSRGLIELALAGAENLGTIRHEAIHALFDMGLFTKAEIATLRRAAKQWRKDFNIDERYKDEGLTESQLDEEAIAVAYEVHNTDNTFLPPSSLAHKAFTLVRTILDILARYLNIQGVNSSDEIFGKIDDGIIGVRPRTQAWQLKLPKGMSATRPGSKERIRNLGKWFGNSMVRMGNGLPKIVYHNTNDPQAWADSGFRFSIWEHLGFHFGTSSQASNLAVAHKIRDAAREGAIEVLSKKYGDADVSVALAYPQTSKLHAKIHAEYEAMSTQMAVDSIGSHIMPMYLRIENPLRLPDIIAWNANTIITALTKHEQLSVLENIRTDVHAAFSYNKYADEAKLADEATLDIKPIFTKEEAAEMRASIIGMDQDAQQQFLQDVFRSMGYDGIVYKNYLTGEGASIDGQINSLEDSYVAFDADQMKSVNNYGTYGDTENYMYSKGTPAAQDEMNRPAEETEKQQISWLRKIVNAMKSIIKRDKASPDSMTGTDGFSWGGKWLKTSRHIAANNKAFAEFWTWLHRIKQESSQTVDATIQFLRPLGELKKDPEKWQNYVRAMEIAIMHGLRLRPAGYVDGEPLDLPGGWDDVVLVFENFKIEETDVVDPETGKKILTKNINFPGRGKNSTLVGGETIRLEGEDAQAYVMAQEALMHTAMKMRESFISGSISELNQIRDLLNKNKFTILDQIHIPDGEELRFEQLDLGNIGLMTDLELQHFSKHLNALFTALTPELETDPHVIGMAATETWMMRSENIEHMLKAKLLIIHGKGLNEKVYSLTPLAKKMMKDGWEKGLGKEGLGEEFGNVDIRAMQKKYVETREFYRARVKAAKRAVEEEGGQVAVGQVTPLDIARYKSLSAGILGLRDLMENLETMNSFFEQDYMPRSRWGTHYIAVYRTDQIVTNLKMDDIGFQIEDKINKIYEEKGADYKVTLSDLMEGESDPRVIERIKDMEGKYGRDHVVNISHLQDRKTFTPEVSAHFELVEFGMDTPNKTSRDNKVGRRIAELQEKYGNDYTIMDGVADRDDLKRSLSDKQLDLDTAFGLLSSKNSELHSQALKDVQDAVREKGFKGIFKQRKDIPGYELDFDKSIAQYVAGMSRLAAELKYSRKAGDVINKKMGGKMAQHARDTMEYVLDPEQEHRRWRMAGFIWYLGGNFSSAVLQTASIPMIVAPYLTMYTGIKGAPKIAWEITKAGRDVLETIDFSKERPYKDIFFNILGPNSRLTEDEKNAVAKAIAEGVLKPYSLMDEAGFSINPDILTKVFQSSKILSSSTPQNIMQVGIAGMFSTMESASRTTAFLASYRLMKQNPKYRKKGLEVLGKNEGFVAATSLNKDGPDIYDMAKFMIDDTFGMYGKINRPRYQTQIGSLAFQFQSYPHQMFELMGRMAFSESYGEGKGIHNEGRKAFAAMMVMVFLTAGLRGLPGVDDLEELIRFLRRKFGPGLDHDMSLMLREMIDNAGMGQHWAEFIEHGALNAYAGIDIQRRLAFNIPGSQPIKALIGMRGDAVDMLGVPGALVIGNIADAIELGSQGRFAEASFRAVPLFAKNIAEAVYMGNYGVRSKSGNQVNTPGEISMFDVAKKALGFQPMTVSRARAGDFAEENMKKANREYQQRVTKELADLYYDLAEASIGGNREEILDIREDIQDIVLKVMQHNKTARIEHQINPRVKTIRNRVRDRMQPGNIRRMPKRLRRRALEVQQYFK